MIDATHCKAHQHAAGARGGNQAMGRTKGGNTKVHLAVDGHGMPLRAIVTAGTAADYSQPGNLIADMQAEHLIADKGYDSDEIIRKAQMQNMCARIPPRKNRKHQRACDKHLYRQRHLVDNAFARIKQWRGIATRYARNATAFPATVNIRGLIMWQKIS